MRVGGNGFPLTASYQNGRASETLFLWRLRQADKFRPRPGARVERPLTRRLVQQCAFFLRQTNAKYVVAAFIAVFGFAFFHDAILPRKSVKNKPTDITMWLRRSYTVNIYSIATFAERRR